MNRKLLILYTLLISYVIQAQEDAWVYFVDKPDAAYYLANPLEMLTQRSLDRRTAQGIALDNTDVPISTSYISQVQSATGITVMAKSKWMNALHVRGSLTDIQNLESLSFVDHVYYANHSLNIRVGNYSSTEINQKVQDKFEVQINYNYGGSDNQIQMLNGHLLHQQDFTGQGKIIAVLDSGFTGVDTATPFQRLHDNNLILGGYNFPDGNANFYMRHNHGTMVLSTMGGYVDGQLVGTAPDSEYYLFITEDVNSENPVEESYWVEAAELADYYGVDVINSSLGYSTYDNPNYSYSYAQRNGQVGFASRGASIAFQKGIVCVISAGNSGNSSDPNIGIPADAENILTVGAVDNTETYVSFSSIGNTSDGRVKPDVCAKGLGATLSNTSGTITSASGTSFSSPILAGCVASFWSARPNLTAAQVIQFVKESADQYTTPDINKGYGVPDFQLALNLSTQTFNNNTVSIYPNPVSSILTVQLNENEFGTIILHNQLGQNVLTKSVSNQQNKIDVSSLASGIYFYDFSSNNSKLQGKLIKK
jgi:hypothetical protein